jgi:N-acetylneuraminic acid mutarotase
MFLRLILLISAFCVAQVLFGQFVWTQIQDAPFSERDDAVAVSLNGYGYAGTGFDNSFSALNDWWRYNPFLDSWQQMADFPGGARQYAIAFVLNNHIYLGTGVGNGYYNDLWQYNPEDNSWTQMASLPAAARSSNAVFTIGDDAYLCGGFFGLTDHSNEVWKYSSVDDAWTQVASLPVELRLAAGFQIGDFGYVTGGFNETSGTLNSTYKYDPVTDSWSQVGDLPEPRLGAKAAATSFLGYLVCGGSSFSELSNTFYFFDPATEQWYNFETFIGTARKGGIAFTINELLFFGLGISAPPQNERFKDLYAIFIGTSVSEFSELQIKVFPNPAVDFVQLLISENDRPFLLQITDVRGVLVSEPKQIISENQFDISFLSPGIYMLTLVQDENILTTKLVISR